VWSRMSKRNQTCKYCQA